MKSSEVVTEYFDNINKTITGNAIRKIIEDRGIEFVFKKTKEDTFFQKFEKEKDDVFDQLGNSLTSKEQKELFNELEAAWNFTEGLLMEFAYRQGLEDAPIITKELKEFGILNTENF